MRKLLSALTLMLISSSALTVANAASGQDVAEPATVVIYRTAEALKTKRLRLDVIAGGDRVGRLRADDVLEFSGEAGVLTLDTSMPGTPPLRIDLKPGHVHYVHTHVRQHGNQVLVTLVEVEEQLARVQLPSSDQAI